jgi:hypothetical protein
MVIVKLAETLKNYILRDIFQKAEVYINLQPRKLELFHDIWSNCLIFGTRHFLLHLLKIISILPSSFWEK